MNETIQQLINYLLNSTTTSPIGLFNEIVSLDFIPMHGPIHHFIDGAVLLTTYKINGGDINLETSLNELAKRSMQMPGAMCGHWGVCGAVTSIGAALSIIDATGPLSDDGSWDNHMHYTASCLEALASIGGPRCCKRDAFISLTKAIDYINSHTNVSLPKEDITCTYSAHNKQCLSDKCPFHKQDKPKVAFICVHNSCRSQIAEALGKYYAADVFESYSAGTQLKSNINQDAVRLMKQLYGIDMELRQKPKLISDIPDIDMMISMGCNVVCPNVGKDFDQNWQLEDPSGQSDEKFIEIIKQIEANILSLKNSLSK